MKHFHPTRIVFDDQGFPDLGHYISCEDQTLIIISQSVLKLYPEITSNLPPNTSIQSNVGSNPDLRQIEEIQIPDLCTQIVAIGGGSVLDIAKACFAKVITENRYLLKHLVDSPLLLNDFAAGRSNFNLILVPTTFGSSSEITKWGTIWDFQNKVKRSISHDLLYADTALICPQMSCSVPRKVTAYTGLDVFSHALESLWNKNATFLTELYAIKALMLCSNYLPELLNNLNSLEVRAQLAKASFFAGLAFSQTKTSVAHAMSYPLTIFHDIPHGFACSLTLGALFEYNYSIKPKSLEKVQLLLQEKYDNRESFKDCFHNFLLDCGVKPQLRDYGVTLSDIPRLVANGVHPERSQTMLHSLTEEQIRDVYCSVL